MRILYIHNDYIKPSGEEHASGELVALLEEYDHEVRWFKRSSNEIKGLYGKVKSFFTGIYNPYTAKKLAKLLDEYKPDIIQIQNLYPFISTSIFKPIKERKIPTVMRCPNYRLFCPNGLSLDPDGKVCEKCWGKGHELWCIRKNCEQSKFKSIGYAARNAFARISRNILDGVDVFIVQSEFQKRKFEGQGIPSSKIGIVAGILPIIETEKYSETGEWVSFVGRVSEEKGIYEFIETARNLPNITFKVAGSLDGNFIMPKVLPDNIEFMGFIKGEELNEFYSKSKIIVVPSKWYEGFPNVILRGMLLRKPVVTTNIGAMESIIDNDINGLLVSPGSVEDLSEKISILYNDTDRCKSMGGNGYQKAIKEYSREQIYSSLMDVYKQAIENNKLRL